MKLLNRTQILTAQDIVTRDVAVPEWAPAQVLDTDGTTLRDITDAERAEYGVRIRNLSGEGRGAFIQHSLEVKKKEDNKERVDFEIEMLLISMTAVDEENKLIFTLDDVKELSKRSAVVIGRLAMVAQELSGLDKPAADKASKP